MWKTSYDERLADWYNLRQEVQQLNYPDQLLLINDWWYQSPVVPRVINWTQEDTWPNPWELLTNKGYCELARALGIVYTLMLLEQPLHSDLKIVFTGQDNLVLVDGGKYILNWAPGEMLNTHSIPATTVKNTIDSSKLVSFLQ
jgi:hypothetical protein